MTASLVAKPAPVMKDTSANTVVSTISNILLVGIKISIITAPGPHQTRPNLIQNSPKAGSAPALQVHGGTKLHMR